MPTFYFFYFPVGASLHPLLLHFFFPPFRIFSFPSGALYGFPPLCFGPSSAPPLSFFIDRLIPFSFASLVSLMPSDFSGTSFPPLFNSPGFSAVSLNVVAITLFFFFVDRFFFFGFFVFFLPCKVSCCQIFFKDYFRLYFGITGLPSSPPLFFPPPRPSDLEVQKLS